MGIFYGRGSKQFPYTNLHELNLDWILHKIKESIDRLNGVDTRLDKNEQDISNNAGDISSNSNEIEAIKQVNIQQNTEIANNTSVNNTQNTEIAGLQNSKVSKSGDTMTGTLNVPKVSGLNPPVDDQDAANKKFVEDKVASLGTVLSYIGDVATVADLPSTGNKVGDCYFVKSVQSAYAWVRELRWDEFGPLIDLAPYLKKADLATTTGSQTETAMTQKATTDALNLKADKTYVDSQNSAQNTTISQKADKTYVDSQNAAQNTQINNIINGTTPVPSSYTLPMATASALGGIKAAPATAEDTQEVHIDAATGNLKTKPSSGSTYTLPVASNTELGGIKTTGPNSWIGTRLNTLVENEGLYAELTQPTPTEFGGIKANPVTADDTQEVHFDEGTGMLKTKASPREYVLPVATINTLGGVKINKVNNKVSKDGPVWITDTGVLFVPHASFQSTGPSCGVVATFKSTEPPKARLASYISGSGVANDGIMNAKYDAWGVVKAFPDQQLGPALVDIMSAQGDDEGKLSIKAAGAGAAAGGTETNFGVVKGAPQEAGKSYYNAAVQSGVVTFFVPQAESGTLGGIKANAATAEDTQEVRVNSNGFLVTKQSGAGLSQWVDMPGLPLADDYIWTAPDDLININGIMFLFQITDGNHSTGFAIWKNGINQINGSALTPVSQGGIHYVQIIKTADNQLKFQIYNNSANWKYSAFSYLIF